jgi:tetratricopeptide (TPR) repeat protein
MKFDNPVIIAVAAILIVLAVLLVTRNSWAKVPVAQTPREVFAQRSGWRSLPGIFLDSLSLKFKTAAEASAFADLCERSGALRQIIKPRASDVEFIGTDFCYGLIAAGLSTYGNGLGEKNRLREAKEAFDFALLMYPNALPTWASLSLLEYLSGNCESAVAWADKILTYRPDTTKGGIWDKATANLADSAEEKRIAEALGTPDDVGLLEGMREQARQIKRECQQTMNDRPK